MNWYPLTSSDPVPGEPTVVLESGRHYRDVANAIGRTKNSLNEIATMSDIESKAVDKLRERAEKVRENISKAETRYREVGDALVTYGYAHRRAQDSAETLRTNAVAKQAEVDAAERERIAAQRAYDDAEDAFHRDQTPIPPGVRSRRNTAVTTKGRLERELQAIIDSLPGVVAEWNTAAEAARSTISTTIKTDELKDGHWENWGSKLAKTVSDIAGTIAGIAGIAALVLAWVPIVGQVLAAVALIAGAVALIADIALLVGGEGSWLDVGLGLLGLVSFGAGQAIGRSAKALAAKGMAQGTSRASRVSSRMNARVGNPANRRTPAQLFRPVTPSTRHANPRVTRPGTWNTWFNQGARSFDGLKGRAAWLNFVGQPEAARTLQSLNNATRANPAFARNATGFPVTQGQLSNHVFGGTFVPFTLDGIGGGAFAFKEVDKRTNPDLPARQVLSTTP